MQEKFTEQRNSMLIYLEKEKLNTNNLFYTQEMITITQDLKMHLSLPLLVKKTRCSIIIPTHLFVNSEYWGVYNIREKINDHYIKNNYQIESEGLDIIQGMKTTEFGSNKEYNNLRSFIRKNSLKDTVKATIK